MADARLVAFNGVANQCANRRNPGQIVIHAHRSAHENKTGKRIETFWNVVAFIKRDECPRNRMTIQKTGKIAWSVFG